jgi:hypothetical protein
LTSINIVSIESLLNKKNIYTKKEEIDVSVLLYKRIKCTDL